MSPDSSLVAKTNPPVSLADHTEAVVDTAAELLETDVLATRLEAIGCSIDQERIRELARIAALYHDTGKAHPEWQRASRSDHSGLPPHSARSAFYAFRAAEELGLEEKEVVPVIQSILHHHTPLASDHMAEASLREELLLAETESWVANLSGYRVAGRTYPEVTLDRDAANRFRTAQHHVRRKIRADSEGYDEIGLLTTVLRTALIQADHHASARERGETSALPETLDPSCVDLFPNLRPFQRAIQDNIGRDLVGLAGCGEGKTHSALQWGRDLLKQGKIDRLVFAMPTQVTTNNLLLSIVGADGEGGHVDAHQAALYHSAASDFFEHAAADEMWDTSDAMLQERARQWFQNPVTVSTIDHVLSTLVNGYRWASVAKGNLLRAGIVFDEIHAYDDHLTGHVLGAIRKLQEYGVPWYVMTATLPPAVRNNDALRNATVVESDGRLRLGGPKREPFVVSVSDRTLTADRALEAADETGAKRIMVVKNTVAEARDLANDLRSANERVTYYSSEFVRAHRHEKESDIRARFGDDTYDVDERRFLVTTQICEISLDLSADLLLTDVAPIDALLQRAGRLHRTGVRPHASTCRDRSDCGQCRAHDDHTYECRVFAPLDSETAWYPYAESRDTDDWQLLENTVSVLADAETYRFDRSQQWIEEAYADVPLDYDDTTIRRAITEDWFLGPRRAVAADVDEGTESLTLRSITSYRRDVLAARYTDPDGTSWSPAERWASEHDCAGSECDFTDPRRSCRSDFLTFFERYAVPIPNWWLHSDDVSVNAVPFETSCGSLPGVPAVDLEYRYEHGIIVDNAFRGP